MEIELHSTLKQRYPLTNDEISEMLNILDQAAEILASDEEFPEKEFFINFTTAYRLFLQSESLFLGNRFEKALKSYEKLRTSMDAIQTQFPAQYSALQYDIDRVVLRVDARLQELRAMAALETQDTVQADVLLVEAVNRYSTELQFEQGVSDYDHYFDSLGNIFRSSGHLYLLRGQTSQDRRTYYEAIKNFKKAGFLGQPNLTPNIQKAHQAIIILTISKLENQAETLFGQGLKNSEIEKFDDARWNYYKSAQLFSALKRTTNDEEQSGGFELQEQLQYSSYYEATAKDLMSRDENEQAAEQFGRASQTLQNVVQKIPSETLKRSFEPQIAYFDSMALFARAVTSYDRMEPEAITQFIAAQEKIEKAKQQAEASENAPLVKNCTDALNKLNSYQEVATLMFQSEES